MEGRGKEKEQCMYSCVCVYVCVLNLPGFCELGDTTNGCTLLPYNGTNHVTGDHDPNMTEEGRGGGGDEREEGRRREGEYCTPHHTLPPL